MDDFKLVPAIVQIPDNAIKIEITATIFDGEEMHKAVSVMNTADVIDARIDGEEWEKDNAKYVFTDKAKKELGIL